ncbi:MAG: prolipoprotein diacylglyceryl transferase [bacterium]|nr:prolipoprotein diacylglyceryl transferase [bacterium]
MHRVIVNLGPISITSWGLSLALAFFIGIWLVDKRAQKYNISRPVIADLCFLIIISSVVGARGAYIIENFSYYSKQPMEIFKIWEGGMILYGGVLVAILCGIIFLSRKRINILSVMDIFAPSIAMGIGIGRLGCFFNGCCFGRPTNLPWGAVFPPDSPAGSAFQSGVHIHPTQIYESLVGFCIFGFLLLLEKIVPSITKKSKGYLFWILLILYSIWRFFIDYIRYYESNAYIFVGFTHGQIVSICLLLVSVIAIILVSSKKTSTR